MKNTWIHFFFLPHAPPKQIGYESLTNETHESSSSERNAKPLLYIHRRSLILLFSTPFVKTTFTLWKTKKYTNDLQQSDTTQRNEISEEENDCKVRTSPFSCLLCRGNEDGIHLQIWSKARQFTLSSASGSPWSTLGCRSNYEDKREERKLITKKGSVFSLLFFPLLRRGLECEARVSFVSQGIPTRVSPLHYFVRIVARSTHQGKRK